MIKAALTEMLFWSILQVAATVLLAVYFDLLSYLFDLLHRCCKNFTKRHTYNRVD